MKIINNIENIPKEALEGITTIGVFDGVHLGHKHLLNELNIISKQNNDLPKIIITFSNHPFTILSQNKKIELLLTLDEKLELFKNQNIDFVFLLEFNKELANNSADEFFIKYIMPFSPKRVIVGRNHFFGRNKEGNTEFLKKHSINYNYIVHEVPAYIKNGINVSSTTIRNLIKKGQIAKVSELLGYNYFFSGTVIKGNKLGKTIGFPTANIVLTDLKLIPAFGVYASYVYFENKKFLGMLYVGIRPTFIDNELRVEINIFDLDEDLYDKTIKIEILKYIRKDIKFSNVSELKAQLEKDKEKVLEIFANVNLLND